MTYNTIGQCPHCQSKFDAKAAIEAFPGNIGCKRLSLVFGLCPDCYTLFQQSNEQEKSELIKVSYINLLKDPSDEWTVVSNLAFVAHGESFFHAWWEGVDLPDALYELIDEGKVNEIVFLPLRRILCK